jgi:metacaspase-1
MGRFLRKLKNRFNPKIEDQDAAQRAFEDEKPDTMKTDIRMISGCDDHQTSADVSNVNSFQLPDPAGRAGGACTSTLLRILYQDETTPEDVLSFTQVLEKMREDLSSNGYTQIPQLTSNNPIDVNCDFDLVPPTATGTRRVSKVTVFCFVVLVV